MSGAGRSAGRRRDPEGRRQALTAAVLETIAEVGAGRTTHRAVAARAGLPLGATTYYFPTLNDMIAAGLQAATEAAREELRSWTMQIRTSANVPRTVALLIEHYVADRARALLEYELYLSAARDARLRPLAKLWLTNIRDSLTPVAGERAARAAAALIDGTVLEAIATAQPLDTSELEQSLKRLLT
ncbi:TetR/AcrR family transcriptional regulator [Flindersiella endophytica]